MPIDPIDRIEYDRNLAAARAQIDDVAFAAAWAAGRALTLEQAITEALNRSGAETAERAEPTGLFVPSTCQRLSGSAGAAAEQAMPLNQTIAEAQSLIRKPAAPIRKSADPDGLISDAQWQRIAPELPRAPEKKSGRPRLHDRQAMTAIFYALETGCGWKALPRALGAPSTIHDRFRAWRAAGVFERLWQARMLPDAIARRLALTNHAQEI